MMYTSFSQKYLKLCHHKHGTEILFIKNNVVLITGNFFSFNNFLTFNIFIYFFFWLCLFGFAACGLSLVAANRSYSLVAVCSLLTDVAIFVAEHKL